MQPIRDLFVPTAPLCGLDVPQMHALPGCGHRRPTQPLLLQGQQGLSRKGPQAAQASYYYSQPQLAVSGRLVLGPRADGAQGLEARVELPGTPLLQ